MLLLFFDIAIMPQHAPLSSFVFRKLPRSGFVADYTASMIKAIGNTKSAIKFKPQCTYIPMRMLCFLLTM